MPEACPATTSILLNAQNANRAPCLVVVRTQSPTTRLTVMRGDKFFQVREPVKYFYRFISLKYLSIYTGSLSGVSKYTTSQKSDIK